MAAKFDLTNFTTPTAEQLQNASEVIVKEVFVNSPLEKNYDIQTGIQRDKQIVFADGFDVVGKAIDGCTPEEIGTVALTDKEWTPKLIAGRFTFCASDENQLLGILKKARNVFPDFFQRNEGSDADLSLIAGIVMNSIQGSILPKAWFSDTAADTIANSGVFKNGTDLDLFNQLDGGWKQIFADNTIPVYTITKNAGNSYANQALASGDALTILKNVYLKASVNLKALPNAKFYVSRSIYENLLFAYSEKGADNGGLTQDLQNGISVLKFMGREVVAEDSWDYTINKYQNNGTVWNKPHRVVFTVKENIPIGTLSKDDLAQLKYHYVEHEYKNYIDFGYFLDMKVLRGDLISAAY